MAAGGGVKRSSICMKLLAAKPIGCVLARQSSPLFPCGQLQTSGAVQPKTGDTECMRKQY